MAQRIRILLGAFVVLHIAACGGGSGSTGSKSTTLPPAATPTFSPAPGTYSSPQKIAISDSTPGATIYYTIDGSTPSTSSTPFSASSPITVSTTTTVQAIAVASGYSTSSLAFGTYTISTPGPTVSVFLTTHDKTRLLAAQPSVTFASTTADATTNTVVVDSTQQYQTMDGFGAAFTDSAAYLLNEVAQKSQLSGILSDLFTRSGGGIGLSFMRVPVGASDLARSVYSFDDMPVGQTDPTLQNFSMAHDQTDIIPIVLQAESLNPQMKLMATPWSPPGWMKDPTSMSPVSMLGGTLLMTSTNESAFANYLVKYLQAYQAAGIHFDYLTLQNEPLNMTTSYPSMGMSQNTQLALLQNNVLPAFASNNITTKILVYDHNWDTPSYPEFVLSGLSAQQLQQVAGTAWHGYAGTPGAQQNVQNEFPGLGTWMTELSGGGWVLDQYTADFLGITQVVRNSAKAYVKWSLALDETLGPNLTQDAGLGGCNTCTPIVTVNSQTGDVTKTTEYYTLGQYSKYVLPGAVRVYSSNTPAIASVAFTNPDGSTVLVAYNSSSSGQALQVQWGGYAFTYTLPAEAAATFTWDGAQTGTTMVAATSQIQGSSFSTENGLQTENTADASGEYDLGYLTPGASAVYTNVDFGNGVNSVNVRTASGGNGGTASFYLDSKSGTPIATVTLPVTGGWQTWQTVTAPVNGAVGGHTLYVVFSGGGTTGSIANVNWFQFQ